VTASVVVTGANGFVGARVCRALVERGATVRAVVRRPGTAPDVDGVEEHVGDFLDPELAPAVVAGATAVVTTVHPMGDDRETQQRVSVEGTAALARLARDAGVGLTRVLVRPPAILGSGDTSIWNTLRPASMRDDEDELAAGPVEGGCTAVNVAGAEPASEIADGLGQAISGT